MKRITKESLNDIVSLAELNYSPSGDKIAYTRNMLSEENNNYSSNICVYDFKNKTITNLTTSNVDKSLCWLDEDTLIFQSKRKSTTNQQPNNYVSTTFYKISLSGGEATKAFEIPLEISGFKILNKEKFVFTSRVPVNMSNEYTNESINDYYTKSKQTDYTIFDELPFWSNGEGIVNKTRKGLFVFDVSTNHISQISPRNMNVDGFSIKNYSNTIYYYGTSYADIYTKKSELFSYDYDKETLKQVEINTDLYISSIFPTNNQLIIYGIKTTEINSFSNSRFFTLQDNDLVVLNDLDISVGSSVGSDCRYGKGSMYYTDEDIWYIRAERVDTGIYKLVKGVEKNIVPLRKGAITDFAVKNSNLVYVGIMDQGLQELYHFDINTNIETKITNYNDEFLKSYTISKVEYSLFDNRVGTSLDSFVIKPTNYEESLKYPAILYVRGGPKGISGDNFFHELQLMANNGYFVFYTNPRGSDGRGSDFANIEGDRYGKWDYEDLLDLVEYVLNKYPSIDKNRLGIMGGSYGGFMTNWMVGQTDIFKAAVTQRSIANYVTKCLTTDIGYYHNIYQMGSKTLWEDIDTYWNHSPLKYADKVKTPLLFIHSDEDYRCYMGDALQYFTALKLHGIETRFCLFHKENHELSRTGKPSNRFKRLDEILNWMDKYLK